MASDTGSNGDGPPLRIALDRLTFGLSPRLAEVDQAHVALLAEQLDSLPPILVHADTMQVIDGVHRTTAARQAGRREILAFLFHGDRDEAFAYAVASNVAHGRPLNARERINAALRLVGARPDWSDRRVAETCGLSPTTVGSIRRSTVQVGQSKRAAAGRDGRVRPADPAAQRLRIAAALADNPTASVRQIAIAVGCSPATVLDVRDRLAKGVDPVPPKLRRTDEPVPAADVEWAADSSFGTSGAAFVGWFTNTSIRDSDWLELVKDVPLGRIYEVADEASRRAESWLRFSAALSRRGTKREKKESP